VGVKGILGVFWSCNWIIKGLRLSASAVTGGRYASKVGRGATKLDVSAEMSEVAGKYKSGAARLAGGASDGSSGGRLSSSDCEGISGADRTGVRT
jgi:hypothetical protein